MLACSTKRWLMHRTTVPQYHGTTLLALNCLCCAALRMHFIDFGHTKTARLLGTLPCKAVFGKDIVGQRHAVIRSRLKYPCLVCYGPTRQFGSVSRISGQGLGHGVTRYGGLHHPSRNLSWNHARGVELQSCPILDNMVIFHRSGVMVLTGLM